MFLVWISGKLLLIIIYFSSGQIVAGGQVDGDDIARRVAVYAVPLCYVGFRDVPGVGPGRGSLKFVVEMKQGSSFVGGGGALLGLVRLVGRGLSMLMLGATDLGHLWKERKWTKRGTTNERSRTRGRKGKREGCGT